MWAFQGELGGRVTALSSTQGDKDLVTEIIERKKIQPKGNIQNYHLILYVNKYFGNCSYVLYGLSQHDSGLKWFKSNI